MRLSTSVFLAVSVLYFASFALPFEYAHKVAGGMAQAVTLTGAFATFALLKANRLDLTSALAAFAVLSTLSAMIVMAGAQCIPDPSQCKDTLHLHGIIFSAAFTMGAAAYLGYLAGTMLGLPAWATIAAAVLSAPVLMSAMLPVAMRSITLVVDKLA